MAIFLPYSAHFERYSFPWLAKMVWYRQRWEASESRVFSSVGTVKNSISQRGHICEMGVICSLIWFYNFIFLRSLLPSFFHFTIKPPGDISPSLTRCLPQAASFHLMNFEASPWRPSGQYQRCTGVMYWYSHLLGGPVFPRTLLPLGPTALAL